MLYEMLFGFAPFYPYHSCLDPAALEPDTLFPERYCKHVSAPAKDLLCKLLVGDPGRRLTARGALAHPWLAPGD